ncbi:MAG: late competence development ComFB family protein, partial [Bilophila sp.]
MSENISEECCFDLVHNRNENRVRKAMEELFTIVDASMLSEKDCCDIYAFALNALPARYVQKGTIILREPVRE